MPTYDYKCTSCDNRYEMREGFDAPSRQPCPRCGAVAKRVLHAPPIVFKGSGFYITDSRKGNSVTLTDGPSTGAAETKSEPAAETKPATPAPSTSTTASSSD